MQNLTDEDRRRIFEEEKAKLADQQKATSRSWLKFAVLIIMVAAVIYGAVRLFSIRKEVAETDRSTSQQATENAERLKTIAKSSPQPFSLNLVGQLDRIRSEGSDPQSVKRNIEQVDSKVTYELLKKSADKYAGRPWAFTGTIFQIFERDGHTEALVAIDGWGNKNFRVEGDFATDFVEKNRVYSVGYLAGDYSYKSIAGWDMTIPALAARAMLKPGEARMRK